MTDYKSQKNAELQWFRRFSPSLTIPDTFDPLMTKFQLMKELKAETLKKLPNSVTMIWPLKESFPGKKITYRYQRQDFTIEGHSPLEVFYPGLKTKLNVNGHFTRSGQSATFGLNLALKNMYENHSIIFSTPMIYFETVKVLNGLKIKTTKESKTLFFDSSVSQNKPMTYLENYNFERVIVDTTNWNINSKNIQDIINWAEAKNTELFLIRSHLKLDSLGAEYGLLGSVVRIHRDENLEWNKLLLETLSYAGILAVHEQVYPFLWDEEFLKLTSERTERIRSNTQFFTQELEEFLKTLKHPMKIMRFDHDLFFGISYDGKADHKPEKFLKLSMMHQVPAKYCDSFGFDFLSLTNVISFYEAEDKSILRFCSGDNTENREDALKFIKDYLAFFDQRT